MCVKYQIKNMRKWKLVFVLGTVDHMPGLHAPCSQSPMLSCHPSCA